MRRKRRRWRRHERVCGDNAASRERRRNRVISAARPNTCPIIFRVSGPCGGRQRPSLFLIPPHPRRAARLLFSFSGSSFNRFVPHPLFFFFFFGIPQRETNREIIVARIWGRRKTTNRVVARTRWLLRLTRCHFRRFNDSDECDARNPFERRKRESRGADNCSSR